MPVCGDCDHYIYSERRCPKPGCEGSNRPPTAINAIGCDYFVPRKPSKDGIVVPRAGWDHGGGGNRNIKPRGPCYIATAIYGSYDAPEVLILRRYRDGVLANSMIGRLFIQFYYRFSPPIAEKLKSKKHLNSVVRKVLDKLVNLIETNVN